MASAHSEGYLFGGRDLNPEAARLDLLEELLEATTQRRLDRLGLPWGGRFLEVAAGRASTVMFLLGRSGMSGEVVATDIDTRFLDALAHPNLRVRRHDIIRDDLDALGTFDVVHARMLLQHLGSGVDEAVARMAYLLRPGGVLLIEDTLTNEHADPGHPAADVLRGGARAFADFGLGAGINLNAALTLPRRLRELGLVDVDNEITGAVRQGGDLFSAMIGRSIEASAPRIPYEQLFQIELGEVLDRYTDPTLFYIIWNQLAVWGRRDRE